MYEFRFYKHTFLWGSLKSDVWVCSYRNIKSDVYHENRFDMLDQSKYSLPLNWSFV